MKTNGLKNQQDLALKMLKTTKWSFNQPQPSLVQHILFGTDASTFPTWYQSKLSCALISINLRTTQTFYTTSPTQRGKYLPRMKEMMYRML